MDTQAIILASLRGAHLLALASLVGTLASLTLAVTEMRLFEVRRGRLPNVAANSGPRGL